MQNILARIMWLAITRVTPPSTMRKHVDRLVQAFTLLFLASGLAYCYISWQLFEAENLEGTIVSTLVLITFLIDSYIFFGWVHDRGKEIWS